MAKADAASTKKLKENKNKKQNISWHKICISANTQAHMHTWIYELIW